MNRNRFSPRSTRKKIYTTDSEKYSNRRHICIGDDGPITTKRLSVFCRVKPMQDTSDPTCITVTPPKTIKVSSPDVHRDGVQKETNYVFSEVFDENASQKEVFMKTTFDLVKNFLKGSNGLLLTYGITGSGKTYTMNGVTRNIGILPRCINLIFNSVSGYQAKKYIIKSDKLNGFEVQSEADAMADRQRELTSSIKSQLKLNKKESEELASKRPGLTSPSSSALKFENINHEHVYSIFVTYVEIYNNGVYDLIEDTPDDTCRQKTPQPKLVREDGAHNMYVHGVTEIEVKSADEAFEVYFKGQKKRRLAETALNAESSRSHAIFSIRCVHGSIHVHGDSLQRDRNTLRVSQLSLVDLAGSEKSSRSKTIGQRLREAGCINNSLLTLRTCLEILRENQSQNTNKIVPYRESKLTHLFKKYFESDGDHHIRMIICINPRSEDYEETLHVLKFSEMSQEILINRGPPECVGALKPEKVSSHPTTSINKTPSHRYVHNLELLKPKSEYHIASVPIMRGFDNINLSDLDDLGFPDFSHGLPDGQDLIAILEAKMQKNDEMNVVMQKMAKQLCSRYDRIDMKQKSETDEINRLTNLLNCERMKSSECENHIFKCNAKINDLQKKALVSDTTIKSLNHELTEKKLLLNKGQVDFVRERNRHKGKLTQSKEKIIEMGAKLQKQKSAIELDTLERDRNMLRGRKALNNPDSCPAIVHEAPQCKTPIGTSSTRSTRITSNSSTPSSASRLGFASRPGPSTELISRNTELTLDVVTPYVTVPVHRQEVFIHPNPAEHRRSRSLGDARDHWLDHRPPSAITIAQTEQAVLQPVMKHRKSVSELTDVNDVVNSKTSKYCLTTQTLDPNGDVETRLFKADVIPTVGGGAQVKFNDIEILHHKSPILSRANMSKPQNPRTPLMERYLIKDRCLVSIEGHSSVNQ